VTPLRLLVVVDLDVRVVDLLHECHGAVLASDLQLRPELGVPDALQEGEMLITLPLLGHDLLLSVFLALLGEDDLRGSEVLEDVEPDLKEHGAQLFLDVLAVVLGQEDEAVKHGLLGEVQ